jgi:PAS domain S-box-containing protein
VFQTTANPVVVLDEDERIVEINDPALELFGGSRLEAIGTPLRSRFTPDTRTEAARNWQELLRAGEFVGAQRVLGPSGAEIEVDYAARLIGVQDRSLVVAVALPVRAPSFSVRPVPGDEAKLSKREQEVVALIAMGFETPAIAKELHIAESTVRAHVRNAMKRLGARTRAHLVAIALCQHLLQPADAPSRTVVESASRG